jgi:hypothetical protein
MIFKYILETWPKYLDYTALKMEALYSPKTLTIVYQKTRPNIPED